MGSAEAAPTAERAAALKETRLPGTTTADRRFRLFTVLWAIAASAHTTNPWRDGFEAPIGWATLATAIYLISSPGSIRRLLLFALVQVIEVIWLAPLVPSHLVLVAIVNVAILIGAVSRWRREGADGFTHGAEGDFLTALSPTIRILLLVGYGAAALAKYNTTFLDPLTSCATYIAEFASGGLLHRTGIEGWVHIALAIVPETLVPILLIVPRTRRFGVRFGIGFHLLVSASPYVAVEDFSLTLYALFLLFLPSNDVDALVERVNRETSSSLLSGWLAKLRPHALRAVLLAAALGSLTIASPAFWSGAFWFVGLSIGLFLLAQLTVQLREPGGRPAEFHLPQPGNLALIGLMFVFVANPYLGFRTQGAFTMFSNLVTSGSGTNHLFLPSFDLIGLQDDLVVPATGSSEHFSQLIEDGHALHYFEVQRIFVDHPDAVVVGTRGGKPIDSRDPSFEIEATSVFSRKALIFRPVADTGEPQCVN